VEEGGGGGGREGVHTEHISDTAIIIMTTGASERWIGKEKAREKKKHL